MHIALAVVNDLNYDQRMQRICTTLAKAGYEVTLLGRTLPNSKPLSAQLFRQKRFHYFVNKGKLFYLFHNLRLLLYYLRHRSDVYVANDLDTAPAAIIAAAFWQKKLVYDAHEYFSELPEVVHRPLVKKTWEWIEKWCIARTNACYTINDSYAQIFEEKYHKHFFIVRNATVLTDETPKMTIPSQKYILYQGAVNVGRGVEQMIEAMQYLPELTLIICGQGDVLENCKELTKSLGLENQVEFKGVVAPENLKHYTREAYLGFTFFTQDGHSYYYSLANRFFDYMHHAVPQLLVDFPEYRRINNEFEIGLMLPDISPKTIAEKVQYLWQNPEEYLTLKQNCLAARQKYNWQNEAKTLLQIYADLAKNMQD
ncbi:MAG: glycosyltransferase [Chitinophagales bacterium]|nr:glycosyltransferase [Bacteroidota bacterium]MCB9044390.1 glycosyltransferase [Chitinophagales bacterium]